MWWLNVTNLPLRHSAFVVEILEAPSYIYHEIVVDNGLISVGNILILGSQNN